MIKNRSLPSSAVIPVLAYDDVANASDWLCRAFGFKSGFASATIVRSSCSATVPSS